MIQITNGLFDKMTEYIYDSIVYKRKYKQLREYVEFNSPGIVGDFDEWLKMREKREEEDE